MINGTVETVACENLHFKKYNYNFQLLLTHFNIIISLINSHLGQMIQE